MPPRPDEPDVANRTDTEIHERIARLGVNINERPAAGNNFEGGLNWLYSKALLFCRLVYFFLLSAHHDWIDPALRGFDN